MSILFLAGVMGSIYGAEFDIGTGNLEFAQLIAPVVPVEPQPNPPRQSPQQQQSADNSLQRPMRQAAVQNIAETPNKILAVSSVPSEFKERPEYGTFDLGPIDIDPPSGPTGITTGSGNDDSGLARGTQPGDKIGIATIPPPPIVKVEPKKTATISLGVVNGKATSLPPPPYPPAARAIGANGAVSVQIMIDVDGRVISSKAVSGHPLLKKAAEDAARRARFSPTLLSKEPVKVTGFITYNFKI
jgi:protein TonB